MSQNRIHDAAISLVLRTRALSLGHQALLDPLVKVLATVEGPFISTKQDLDAGALPTLWALLETMDKMGVLDPASFRAHRALLVRAEFQALSGEKRGSAPVDLVLKRTAWEEQGRISSPDLKHDGKNMSPSYRLSVVY